MLITKGELLTVLGADSNKFTAFMMDPAQFGVTEPYLTALKLAKQKFDWTANIETDLPEIQELIALLKSLGVFTDANIAAIYAISTEPKYAISVIAQDTITLENNYGAVQDGDFWNVRVDFRNETLNTVTTEMFVYDYIPTESDIQASVDRKIKELKQIK